MINSSDLKHTQTFQPNSIFSMKGFYKRDMHQFKQNNSELVTKICSSEYLADKAIKYCLTSISRGRRVTLCMGRMRKEIMGKFLQSSCDSIRDNTSLKEGLVALWGDEAEKDFKMFPLQAQKQTKTYYQILRSILIFPMILIYKPNINYIIITRVRTGDFSTFSI